MDDLKDDMNRRLQQQVDELRDRINSDRADTAHLMKEHSHLQKELYSRLHIIHTLSIAFH